MYKDYLAKLLAGPIKLYNTIKIKAYYGNLQLKADEIQNLGKTLVLIPHVDDETIGLGGLLADQAKRSQVHLVYGTDSGASRGATSREEISKIRFEEAEKLAEQLGVDQIFKLAGLKNGQEDWSFEAFDRQIKKLMQQENYQSIFTVSPVDAHGEHKRLTVFLARSLQKIDFQGQIYLYEASNFLPNSWINTYYPMTIEELADKKKLYDYFPSQTMMDFDIFQRLNKYKGLALGEKRPVEFFSKMSKKEFVDRSMEVDQLDLSSILPNRIGNNRSFYKVIHHETQAQEFYLTRGW